MKIWKPDTCDCVIEEVYNGTEIVGAGQIIHKCDSHIGVADVDLYGVIIANSDSEQKRIRDVRRALTGDDGDANTLQIASKLTTTKTVGQTSSTELKTGIEPSFTFTGTDHNRQVVMTLNGATLTKTEKTDLQTFLEGVHGTSKIQIN